jgi:WD40 repeat protein
MCDQLAETARARPDHVVRTEDLKALGGPYGALKRYAKALVEQVVDAPADRRALRALMARLYQRLPDGTVVRILVPEPVIAEDWRGKSPLDAVIDEASADDVRLLEVTWLPYEGEETRYVSLSNDALAPLVAFWNEEGERRAHTRKRVVDTLFITVPCILLALVLAYRYYRQASAAEAQVEEYQKKDLPQHLQEKKMLAEGLQAAGVTSYVANLGRASQALSAGDQLAFDQALRTAQVPPTTSDDPHAQPPDPRGFEWYYLWRRGHHERATFAGHGSLVSSVALSPDGALLASASADGTVKLWDAAAGQERATLVASKRPLHAVAISGDGKLVASGGEDGVVRLWDADTGKGDHARTNKARTELPSAGGPVRALAFSRDGKTLAAAGLDPKDMAEPGVIHLYDIKDGKETRTLRGHKAVVTSLAFSPDGKVLASGDADRAALIWDPASGQKQRTLPGQRGSVNAVAFAPDGKSVAVGGATRKDGVEVGYVRLFDTATGKDGGALELASGVLALAFAPDGATLIAGAKADGVQLWDVAGRKLRGTLRGHVGWIGTVAVATGSKTIATGSFDSTAKLWDLDGGQAPTVLRGRHGWVCAVALAPDGKQLATGADDGTIVLWDPATGKEAATLKGHTGAVVAVAYSAKAGLLATGSWDEAKGQGQLKLWDADPASKSFGKEQRQLAGHATGVVCLAFAPDGRTLASGGTDGKVIFWDPASGEKRGEVDAHKGVVRCVAFAPNGRYLASGGDDATISVRGPDGRPILFEASAQLKSAQPFGGHTAAVTALAFAANSAVLASASEDRTVRLWNVNGGASRAVLRGHGRGVFALAFAPQGSTLASGGADGSVKLWDAETGNDRFTFLGHSGTVRAVAFSPDLTLLASGGHDGTVRLWRAAPPEPVAAPVPHE